jgi:hypothetical protein
MVKDMVENSSRKTAHRVRPRPPTTGRPLTPSLSSCAPLEGTGFEPPVPLLRRFCRAVNPDAVMKTEAPKVRSRRRRLPGAPSYSYSVRVGLGVRICLPPADSPCLAGYSPPTSKSRAFPASVRGGAGSAVGRDGSGAVIWRRRAAISLSGKFQYRSVDAPYADCARQAVDARVGSSNTEHCQLLVSGQRQTRVHQQLTPYR